MKKKELIIKANILYNGINKTKNQTLVIKADKINDISKSYVKADFEGIVTPGFIDPHSHIGMFRFGEPGIEQEGNEFLQQIMPLNNPLNSIYTQPS